jgi:hypothetical protein
MAALPSTIARVVSSALPTPHEPGTPGGMGGHGAEQRSAAGVTAAGGGGARAPAGAAATPVAAAASIEADDAAHGIAAAGMRRTPSRQMPALQHLHIPGPAAPTPPRHVHPGAASGSAQAGGYPSHAGAHAGSQQGSISDSAAVAAAAAAMAGANGGTPFMYGGGFSPPRGAPSPHAAAAAGAHAAMPPWGMYAVPASPGGTIVPAAGYLAAGMPAAGMFAFPMPMALTPGALAAARSGHAAGFWGAPPGMAAPGGFVYSGAGAHGMGGFGASTGAAHAPPVDTIGGTGQPPAAGRPDTASTVTLDSAGQTRHVGTVSPAANAS